MGSLAPARTLGDHQQRLRLLLHGVCDILERVAARDAGDGGDDELQRGGDGGDYYSECGVVLDQRQEGV